jgi:hypothetical protein
LAAKCSLYTDAILLPVIFIFGVAIEQEVLNNVAEKAIGIMASKGISLIYLDIKTLYKIYTHRL